jgi:hypothetical protein
VLVALAGLVLHRLPKTGLKDTGTQHKIQYEAIGTGRAKSIQWGDYTDIQGAGELSSTRIPWLKTVPMATFATSEDPTSEDPTSEDPTPDPPFLRVEAGSPAPRWAA